MRESPAWRDIFHQVRDLIKALNNHMKIFFIPGWISCIDEFMSRWNIGWLVLVGFLLL